MNTLWNHAGDILILAIPGGAAMFLTAGVVALVVEFVKRGRGDE